MRQPYLHRPLLVTAALMAVLVVVSSVGLVSDDRILLGVPIWLKPLKFAISFVIYTATLAWLLSLVTSRRRTGWWLGTVIAATGVIEMAIIVGQAARGRRSHFNVGTSLDSTLFSVMGVTIVALWLATAGIAVLLMRERLPDRAIAMAIRLGLLVALGGLGVGFLMVTPTPEQAAAMGAGPPTVVGAHAVGVPDGGPGLPLVNWSTTGGDLRIGHFIGMHALQAIPLLALVLTRLSRRSRRLRSERTRVRLVIVAAAGYAALAALLTWQALRGQSLIHPDTATITAASVLLVALAAGTTWALASTPVPGEGRDGEPTWALADHGGAVA